MTISYHSGGRLQGIETDRLGDILIQGHNGGVGSTSRGGGGGGGAGAVGGNGQGNGSPAGDGGIGLQSDITGTNTYYAGGGGGGRDTDVSANSRVGYGGNGGGGNGEVAGTDYLGGGGGGGSGDGGSYTQAGAGGKGVVILQFTTSGTSYSQTGTYDTPDTSTVSGKTILRWTGSGTFVLSSGTPDVEYLVVAGGGGGYSSSGNKRGTGGGGAGGLLTGTKSSMANGTYTVAIGNGGAVSNNGDDSVFSDVTTTGGGTGGNNSNASDAQDGGSGGGSGEFTTTSTPLGETINLNDTPTFPSDVPDYTRAEITDTRKMYSYLPPPTVTFEDDFTSSTGWTPVGSGVTITGGVIDQNGFSSSGDNRIYKDVGVLEDIFIAQFDYKTVSATNGAYWTMFAFTDNTNAVRTSQDGVYALIDMGSWNVYLRNGDAGTETAGTGNISLSSNTQYYVTFIRDGSTTTLNIYTDSARTTLFGTLSTTIGGTVDGLQYFQTGATHNGNTGTVSIQLDNLEIYNGITSISTTPSWKEKGTT